MRVALVAQLYTTVVRLGARMHVRMFLPIATVRKSSTAALRQAHERFLTCNVIMFRCYCVYNPNKIPRPCIYNDEID